MSSKDKTKNAKAASKASSSKSAAKKTVVSSPKVSVKATAKPVVKSAAKPAAKTATKSAAKAPVKTAAKTAAKPVVNTIVKTDSKSAAKPTSKPSAKTTTKSASKPVSKPLVKAVAKAQAKKAATKPVSKAPASKPAVKLVAKPSAEGGVVSKQPVKTEQTKVIEPVAKTMVRALLAEQQAKAPVVTPVEKKEPPKEKDLNLDEAVLLIGGKKLLKTSFFAEVDDAEERANKKKYSAEAKGPEKPTAYSRRKSSLVEETPEELIERLAMELEEENLGILREAEMQVCTKCGLNPVSPEFRVDKDLGYCDECAEILHLGQTKEARKVDYQMSLMRKDAIGGSSDGDEDAEDLEMDDDEVEDLEDED